jgi:probable HAF family extracellular repeat protein
MKRIGPLMMKRTGVRTLLFCTCFAFVAWLHAEAPWKPKIIKFNAPGAGTGAGQGTGGIFGPFSIGVDAISPPGAISGAYADANNVLHGFLRTHDGTITTFDAPGAGTGTGQGMLLAALAIPIRLAAQNQPEQHNRLTHYTVINLGSLGGTNCCLVIENNNRGWVDGTSNLAGDQSFHPFLWRDGKMQDLGTLGGPNASAGGMNDVGDVTVGGSDTGIPDPLGEDACGFGTFQTCLSFIWHKGKRIPVPTLGGNNGDVSTIKNGGQVLGFAETVNPDPTCVAPQALGHEAFIWEPNTGEIHQLPPLTGDSASAAFDMNNAGQAIGFSGGCGSSLTDFFAAFHAVRWQDGIPTDLGNLGGTLATGFGINNRGQVAGVSALAGDTTFHAFLWNEEDGMRDLGTLPGDTNSFTGNINDKGQVPIQSCDALNNCRAAIWQDGRMTDLNTLIPPGSPLFLTLANAVNSRGEIVGAAFDQSTGATVPFLAVPCDEKHGDDQGCKEVAQGANDMRGESSEHPKVTLPGRKCHSSHPRRVYEIPRT